MVRVDVPIKAQFGCDDCHRFLLEITAAHKAEVERLREALDYIYTELEDLIMAERRAVNPHGWAFTGVTSDGLKVRVDSWTFTGVTIDGIEVRVEFDDPAFLSARVWLDGVEVAVTGLPSVLRDGGTRHIPTERGVLTLPHKIGSSDRMPRLRATDPETR